MAKKTTAKKKTTKSTKAAPKKATKKVARKSEPKASGADGDPNANNPGYEDVDVEAHEGADGVHSAQPMVAPTPLKEPTMI